MNDYRQFIFCHQVDSEYNQIKYDFQVELIDSCGYCNFVEKYSKFRHVFSSDGIAPPGTIPVGSVEFVTENMKNLYGVFLKPLNVPKSLYSYAGRWIGEGNKEAVQQYPLNECALFVKAHDRIKAPNYIIYNDQDMQEFLQDEKDFNDCYQFSDMLEDSDSIKCGGPWVIDSEWRVFVFKQFIQGVRQYQGSWFGESPNHDTIREMISAYKDAPPSYTLDVANLYHITDKVYKTVIIEAHEIYSCGLYGYSSTSLPYMYLQWFFSHVDPKNC